MAVVALERARLALKLRAQRQARALIEEAREHLLDLEGRYDEGAFALAGAAEEIAHLADRSRLRQRDLASLLLRLAY